MKETNFFTDFRLLLILFIAFRVMMLIGYPPFLVDGHQGIGVGGDRTYHYELSSLEDENRYPFRDWWSEFPPVWYLTTTGIHALLGENATYHNWSLVLGLLVITSEAGVLTLLYKIGRRIHSEITGLSVAWAYALLAAPAIFMWWNFDTLVTFFFLLGIWLLLQRSDWRASAVIAFGALVKFVPLLLFGAAIRFFKPQRTLRVIAVTLGIFALAYAPLVAINPQFSLISLTAQFGKPSYQTVWAIIDGNYTTGNFGTIESHFTAEGVTDGIGDRNPATVPSWLRLGIAAALGLFVFIRTRRTDEVGLLAFIGITLVIFFLQSQGWSPQWITQIIPLVLLVFPSRNAVLAMVMLSLLAFIEYPFIFIRSGDGIIAPEDNLYLIWVLVVGLRTLMLAAVGIAFYRKLRQRPIPELAINTEERPSTA